MLAAIGTLPDTITDRAVNIRLRRRKPTETVSQYRIRRHQPHLLDLRARLTDWISTHLDTLTGADPDTPLEDRAADVWEPLFAVADLAGGRWPALTRDAAVHLASEAAEHDSEASEGMELLRDIRNALTMLTSDFVPSTNLITLLKSAEESRWDETGLTARRLADLLKPYQIRPRHSASGNARGYRTREFEDAFARYLPDHRHNPSEPSETPPDQHKRSDTLKPSDTSNRQTETNRQNVSPGQTPYLTHLTGSDNPRTEHDHTTAETSQSSQCSQSPQIWDTTANTDETQTSHPSPISVNSTNTAKSANTDRPTDDPDEHPDVACEVCGRTITGRWAHYNGTIHPGCKTAAQKSA